MSDKTIGDVLNDPLGVDTGERSATRRDLPYARIAFSGMGLVAVLLVAFALLTDERRGGEPVAVSQIDVQKQLAPAPPAPPPAVSLDTTGSIQPRKATSSNEIEAQSGVKVIRPNGAQAPGALVIQVPQAMEVRLTPAPDKRLVEKGRYGPLPRIGPDGARPAEIYSRPVLSAPGLRAGAPRIGILVGGLGLNAATTLEAIARLPGAVSLAFAPYGDDLAGQVAQAREEGHEVFLQAPMEPFDYPANNPGPHTLLTSLDAAQNADQLAWLMSRFVGYVGVTNFLGGKFTAEETSLGPVLRELSNRGLIFVDDNTSTRSLSLALAAKYSLPALQADIVIDATARPEAIELALGRLEALALAKGSAIGAANALPATIEHVARFARRLETHGINLVAVSAFAETARPSAQR
jgi:polysaccharide deacetylase 2 family uncharacterized protein YibQ